MSIFFHFAGGWVTFEGWFATLGFGSAHQVIDKKPKPIFIMSIVRASIPQSSRTQPTIAWPTFQMRKFILETSFAIKEDFMNFDAKRWVVQEF
jgi:hypothetical protein